MLIVVAIIAIGVPVVASAANLSIGSTGNEVVKLQTFLIENGFPIPLIESGSASKGYFGTQTSDAVKMYQESVGEYPTGSIDSEEVIPSLKLGAVTGPDVNFRSFFNAGLTQGGRSATTSNISAYRTIARDFNGTPAVLLWTPNVNTTVTLSSTSTFAYIPKIGDVARVMILNASTTAGSTITFAAADANLDLQFGEATGGDLVLNGLDWAELILIRQTANKVSVIFNEFTEAD